VRKRIYAGFTWILMVGAALLARCLETETVLGPVEQASVDAQLIGDFKTGDDGGGTDITVRNFNGREYYIEQRAAGQETVRYGGHITLVKGASFLHLRPLSDDATSSKTHAILRVDRLDDAKVNRVVRRQAAQHDGAAAGHRRGERREPGDVRTRRGERADAQANGMNAAGSTHAGACTDPVIANARVTADQLLASGTGSSR
jgi:hypothetical protein